MFPGFLVALLLALFLSWVVAPSASTVGAMRWGRRIASFGVFVTTISLFSRVFSDQSQGGINAFAVWLLNSVVVAVVGLIIGYGAYSLFSGAKKLAHIAQPRTVPDTSEPELAISTAAEQYAPAYAERKSKTPLNQLDIAASTAPNTLPEKQDQSKAHTELSLDLSNAVDDAIYGQISREIESKQTDEALWTKAFAASGGDDKQTRVTYIKLRYDRLFPTQYAKAIKVQQAENTQKQIDESRRVAAEHERIKHLSWRDKFELGLLNGEVEQLLSNGDGFRFLIACRRMDLDEVEQFVKDNILCLVVTDSDGNSGLHIAIQERREDIAEYLTVSGSSVLLKNKAGRTPLDLAKIMFPRISNATALIERHARLA